MLASVFEEECRNDKDGARIGRYGDFAFQINVIVCDGSDSGGAYRRVFTKDGVLICEARLDRDNVAREDNDETKNLVYRAALDATMQMQKSANKRQDARWPSSA